MDETEIISSGSEERPSGTCASVLLAGAPSTTSRTVAVPSDLLLPVLFSLGGSGSSLAGHFDVVPEVDRAGTVTGATVEICDAAEDTTASVAFRDPSLVGQLGRGLTAGTATWCECVRAGLPRMLGPEAFVTYCLTWLDVDGGGRFNFVPHRFLKSLGLGADSRAAMRVSERLRRLTRTFVSIRRARGPSTSSPKSEPAECPLVEDVSGGRPVEARPGSGSRVFQHSGAMRRLRRKYHVNVPLEALLMVGSYREAVGRKDDGFAASALCIAAYIRARAFAGRKSRRAGPNGTYFGPEGFRVPLDAVLTTSGFSTPASLRQHRGREVERARAAVATLTNRGLLGPGSTVISGREHDEFVFVAPKALHKDLAQIVPGSERPM